MFIRTENRNFPFLRSNRSRNCLHNAELFSSRWDPLPCCIYLPSWQAVGYLRVVLMPPFVVVAVWRPHVARTALDRQPTRDGGGAVAGRRGNGNVFTAPKRISLLLSLSLSLPLPFFPSFSLSSAVAAFNYFFDIDCAVWLRTPTWPRPARPTVAGAHTIATETMKTTTCCWRGNSPNSIHTQHVAATCCKRCQCNLIARSWF